MESAYCLVTSCPDLAFPAVHCSFILPRTVFCEFIAFKPRLTAAVACARFSREICHHLLQRQGIPPRNLSEGSLTGVVGKEDGRGGSLDVKLQL